MYRDEFCVCRRNNNDCVTAAAAVRLWSRRKQQQSQNGPDATINLTRHTWRGGGGLWDMGKRAGGGFIPTSYRKQAEGEALKRQQNPNVKLIVRDISGVGKKGRSESGFFRTTCVHTHHQRLSSCSTRTFSGLPTSTTGAAAATPPPTTTTTTTATTSEVSSWRPQCSRSLWTL